MTSEMWIEGVSNGVTIFFCVLFSVFLSSIYAFYRAVKTPSIHFAAQENVNHIRENMSQDRQEFKHRTPPERKTIEEIQCPICLNPVEFAIETNCGHRYCGSCFFEYHRRENNGRLQRVAVRCPCCRRMVDTIHDFFSDQEQKNAVPSRDRDRDSKGNEDFTPSKVIELVTAYNRTFSNEPRTFRDVVLDTPTLLRHMWRQIANGGPGFIVMNVYLISVVLVMVLYLVCPIDIIPEAIFGLLGFLDDLIIGSFLLVYLAHAYRRHRLSPT